MPRAEFFQDNFVATQLAYGNLFFRVHGFMSFLVQVSCWFHVGSMPVSCQTSPTTVIWKEAGEVEEKREADKEAGKHRASRNVVVLFIGVCGFMLGFMYGFMSGVSVLKR